MVVRNILVGIAILSLVACQSNPNNSRQSSSQNVKQAERTDRLSPRDMPYGECGLFVWQLDPEPKLVLFSQADDDLADWWSESTGSVEISRISSGGFETQGQSPIQSFSLPDGSSLKLDLRNPASVDNGTMYKNGTLTLPATENLEMIMPVSGMTACNLNPVAADYTVRTIR